MKTKTKQVGTQPTAETPILEQSLTTSGFSRRDFLKGTGMLVVSFSLAGSMKLTETEEVLAQGTPVTKVDSFVAIAKDGSVTGFTGKVDLGTGTSIGLRQMLAEELDVAFERITWIQGDTDLCPSQGATVGSQSIRSAGPTIRQAGAAARQFLVNLASQRLNVPASNLEVNDGVVSVKGDPSKKVTYWDLIGGQRFNIDVPAANQIQLKTPSQWRVIGKRIKRGDIGERVNGDAFVHNVRVPGMVHGRSIKPPTANAKVVKVDESSVSGIPGFIKVVVKGDYVGVVCEREEDAINAARLLKVTWTAPEVTYPKQQELHAYMKTLSDLRPNPPAPTLVGDINAGLAAAAKKYEVTYLWPFQMHASIAPPTAVADVKGNKATVWSGGQNTFGEIEHINVVLGIPAANIRVIWLDSAGYYGRSGSTDDVSLEAAILSQAVGRPVRVQWLRADEHGYEPKGPPHVVTIKAGVDNAGNITAWDWEDRFFPLVTLREPLARRLVQSTLPESARTPETMGSDDGSGGNGLEYNFPAKRITALRLPWVSKTPSGNGNNWSTGLRTNHLRAPGDPARHFGTECFIDELASAAKVDPLQYRLRQSVDQRMIGVLQAAADRYGWQPRPAPLAGNSRTGVVTGRGIAFGIRTTYTSAIVDIEIDQSTGIVRVKRVVIGQDCGMNVNPDSIEQQIEGMVTQTIGRTLHEEVTFDQFKVTSLDWISYGLIRFSEVPKIESVLIDEGNKRTPLPPTGGVGEPALNPVPAAIGNAIFDATGVRLRQIPFTPERVKAALAQR